MPAWRSAEDLLRDFRGFFLLGRYQASCYATSDGSADAANCPSKASDRASGSTANAANCAPDVTSARAVRQQCYGRNSEWKRRDNRNAKQIGSGHISTLPSSSPATARNKRTG